MRALGQCVFVFVILWAFFGSVPDASACTSFLLKDGKRALMGKSYDWHAADGLLMVNKRNVQKRAFLINPTHKKLAWKSLYGSITFNQYGREMPLGGLNEKGLAIEVLWLNQTRYPAVEQRMPSVNELQWIQYLLDTSANVDQVVKKVKTLQISRTYARVHYLACDKRGICATFEYLRGKLVIHHRGSLPIAALTNHTYKRSISAARSYRGLGGTHSLPRGRGSLSRFCRTAASIRQKGAKATVTRAFQLLQQVRVGRYTKWHIAYELDAGKIHFRSLDHPKIVSVSLANHRFECKSKVQVMDMRGTIIGADAKKKRKRRFTPSWKGYQTRYNKRLIQRSLRQLGAAMGGQFPALLVRALAHYPERGTRCVK